MEIIPPVDSGGLTLLVFGHLALWSLAILDRTLNRL